MHDQMNIYSRTIYGLLDVFGDFGGLLEVVMGVLALIISPWVEFQFNVKAIQKLYSVRTQKNSTFRKSAAKKHIEKRQKIKDRLLNEEDREKFKHVYKGKISMC